MRMSSVSEDPNNSAQHFQLTREASCEVISLRATEGFRPTAASNWGRGVSPPRRRSPRGPARAGWDPRRTPGPRRHPTLSGARAWPPCPQNGPETATLSWRSARTAPPRTDWCLLPRQPRTIAARYGSPPVAGAGEALWIRSLPGWSLSDRSLVRSLPSARRKEPFSPACLTRNSSANRVRGP